MYILWIYSQHYYYEKHPIKMKVWSRHHLEPASGPVLLRRLPGIQLITTTHRQPLRDPGGLSGQSSPVTHIPIKWPTLGTGCKPSSLWAFTRTLSQCLHPKPMIRPMFTISFSEKSLTHIVTTTHKVPKAELSPSCHESTLSTAGYCESSSCIAGKAFVLMQLLEGRDA